MTKPQTQPKASATAEAAQIVVTRDMTPDYEREAKRDRDRIETESAPTVTPPGKYTRGPWSVAEYGITELRAKYLCIKKGGKTITRIDPQGNSTSTNTEDEANARLIAAAPELLAACKELRKHADWVGCPIGYRPKDFKPMFDKADAAIAKAEGK